MPSPPPQTNDSKNFNKTLKFYRNLTFVLLICCEYHNKGQQNYFKWYKFELVYGILDFFPFNKEADAPKKTLSAFH